MENSPLRIFVCSKPRSQLALLWPRLIKAHPNISWAIGPSVNAISAQSPGSPKLRDPVSGNLAVANVNVLLFHNFSVPTTSIGPLISALPNLQWIHLCSAGIDYLKDLQLPPEIQVTNAKGAYSDILAEFVMAAILYFNKQIPRLLSQQANKQFFRHRTSRLEGKVLVIIGYGNIGTSVSRLAKAFGMSVTGVKRRSIFDEFPPFLDSLTVLPNELERGYVLAKTLARADFVVNTLPLTPKTFHYCDEEFFDHLKKSAVFLNIGRGPTVDETALLSALKSKKIKGAALDVFEQEPLPADSPFWDLDNILISPHTADNSEDMDERSLKVFFDNLEHLREEGSFLTVVELDEGY